MLKCFFNNKPFLPLGLVFEIFFPHIKNLTNHQPVLIEAWWTSLLIYLWIYLCFLCLLRWLVGEGLYLVYKSRVYVAIWSAVWSHVGVQFKESNIRSLLLVPLYLRQSWLSVLCFQVVHPSVPFSWTWYLWNTHSSNLHCTQGWTDQIL